MGSGETPELVKVKMASGAGATFGVDDIAIAWATSGGFWAAEGLDVEWTPARGGVKVADAVLAGEVVGGYGTWVPCVLRHREGKPLKVLASMAQALAQNLVVNKTRITCPADLKGKRWSVDGIGALSHTLAQLILQGLGIPETDVEFVVSGPPPQRIAHLLSGEVDCSLVRVEEAAVLGREHPDLLAKLLGFEDILPLAPVQPHGVLSVTSAFAEEHPEVCKKLARGLIKASRDLHENLEAFQTAVRQHVTQRPSDKGPCVAVSDVEVQAIWQQEHDAGSFAVNGGMTAAHWARNLAVYAQLNGVPDAAGMSLEEFAVPRFVVEALAELGVHPATRDQPPPR